MKFHQLDRDSFTGYFHTVTILILLLAVSVSGCRNPSETEPPEPESTTGGGVNPDESGLDWSTVTPEDLWTAVSDVYDSDGPELALLLLERGINKGVVTEVEANQRRAGYLYEMGRMDEAFLAIAIYVLDETRPDLLRLRAEILWSMGRYDEARRDYEVVLDSMGENPDNLVLYQLARLYEEIGDWDRVDEIAAKLEADPGDQVSKQYKLYLALKSERVEDIRDAGRALMESGFERNPMATFAAAYGGYLEGDHDTARGIISDYIDSYGGNLNIISLELRLDAESGDFEKFESDLRAALESQDAVGWIDEPHDSYPSMPEYRTYVSGLLDFASALELGRGDPVKAELLASRALELNPYDEIGLLQQAAVSMMLGDIEASFGKLVDAKAAASPTDIRTRLRMVQFAQLADDETIIPWDSEEILNELDGILVELRKRYPENAFFMAADAEVHGYRGDSAGALDLYEVATSLQGATREMYFRYSYWTAVKGDPETAFEIFSGKIQTESPDLTWARELDLEADATGNESLRGFADRVIAWLDPSREHSSLFY